MSKLQFNQEVLMMDIKKKQQSEAISQNKACEQIGVSKASICSIKNGRVPDISTLLKFVNWTGTDINRYFQKS